jgi:hypothetical protein
MRMDPNSILYDAAMHTGGQGHLPALPMMSVTWR